MTESKNLSKSNKEDILDKVEAFKKSGLVDSSKNACLKLV